MTTHRNGNKVRIIGGTWRSRLITFSSLPGLRPTPDRVRETLFNWLGQTLYGKTCLDLFAGSGALGFEALSRGAEQVVMIEQNEQIIDALHKNAESLKAENLTITPANAIKFLETCHRKFDVVFVDPPYDAGLLPEVFSRLAKVLQRDGIVYFENNSDTALSEEWEIFKEAKSSTVKYHLAKLTNKGES